MKTVNFPGGKSRRARKGFPLCKAGTIHTLCKTCKTDNFFGRHYVDMVQRLKDKYIKDRSIVFAGVDMRSKVHRT